MFSFYRQMRIAGCVLIAVNLFHSNNWILLAVIMIFAWGYMFSVSKIEQYIEEQEEERAVSEK